MPWRPRDASPQIVEADLALVAAYYGEDGPCQTLVDLAMQDRHPRGLRARSPQVLGTRLHRTLRLLGFARWSLTQHRTQADRAQVLAALADYRRTQAGAAALWPPRTQP